MSRVVLEMVDLSKRYCGLIETSGADDSAWLAGVADLLPRLHATITSFDGRSACGEVWLNPDLDARFELYTHLRGLLGERDPYWLEFDRVGDSQAMTGSLADDLTDIYCELKHGLRSVDENPERAVQDWLNGYDNHWGRHLLDAQRHLSALASAGCLN
jgi:hypothetical protein